MGEFELQYRENKGFRHFMGNCGAKMALQSFPELK